MPRLLHALAVSRGDGTYARLLTRLAKLDLLAIDDWMIVPLRDTERRDLTEVIEDRAERALTLIANQLPAPRRPVRRRRHEHPNARLHPGPGPNGLVPSEIATGACPPAAMLPVRCGPEPADGPTS